MKVMVKKEYKGLLVDEPAPLALIAIIRLLRFASANQSAKIGVRGIPISLYGIPLIYMCRVHPCIP